MVAFKADPDLQVAGPEHYEALRRVLLRRRYAVCPARLWTEETLRAHWMHLLEVRFNPILDEPATEILVEVDGTEVRSFVVLLHDTEEGSTGRPQSRIYPPSWLESPRLLRFAAQRARERGAEILGSDVMVGEDSQCEIHEQAGMVAEYRRIVMRLEHFCSPGAGPATAAAGPEATNLRALARSARAIRVHRAELGDRLFLMQLATECVAMMFHERRRNDMPITQERFFDSYTQLELTPDCPLHVWVARVPDGSLAGAMIVSPRCELYREEVQAYIHDISVLPAYWGRAVGPALTLRAIEELKKENITYLTGDISTDNDRVWSLASRFGFVPETLHYVQFVNGEESHHGHE